MAMTHRGQPPAVPRDAAAVILLRDPTDPKVFWVRRSSKLAFMAGYYAFPGGKLDDADHEVPILNAAGGDDSVMRVVAIRELFEETGVLIAAGVERLAAAQRRELREALCTGRLGFGELLDQEDLRLDAALLEEAPRWVTPAALPRRYDTRFYAAWLPAGQETEVLPGELEDGEWLRPAEALRKWVDGEVLIVTPIVAALQALADGVDDFTARMHRVGQAERDHLESRVEMRYGIYLCPLRTPTIPPATHTNCLIVGGDELVIIDPGSPYPDQQERLDQIVDRFLAAGRRPREIIITHLHPDHIGGVTHLAQRYNLPVATHRLTAGAIGGEIRIDRLIEDGDLLVLREEQTGLEWRLRALWTPGHARGHLSFYEERTGTLITGDCVVGVGTVVIAPPEGNMSDYLASLRRYLDLPRLTALMPGHGPVVATPRERIEQYLDHRAERESQILAAVAEGVDRPAAIVSQVYAGVEPALHQLAELTVVAHLEKLVNERQIVHRDGTYKLAAIY
jgi:ribonuclease/clavin/mitogillin